MQVDPALPWDGTVEGGTIQLRKPLVLQQLLDGALGTVFKDGHAELIEGSFSIYQSDNKLYVGANSLDYCITNVDTRSTSTQYSELILERTQSADESLNNVVINPLLDVWRGEDDVLLTVGDIDAAQGSNIVVSVHKNDNIYNVGLCRDSSHQSEGQNAFVLCSQYGKVNFDNGEWDKEAIMNKIIHKLRSQYPMLFASGEQVVLSELPSRVNYRLSNE